MSIVNFPAVKGGAWKAQSGQAQVDQRKRYLSQGSKTTGIAVMRETEFGSISVLSLFELEHRGRQIREALRARRQMRRRRRATLRYREPRFSDRASNLTLACRPCNQKKHALPIESFLAELPERFRYCTVIQRGDGYGYQRVA